MAIGGADVRCRFSADWSGVIVEDYIVRKVILFCQKRVSVKSYQKVSQLNDDTHYVT